MNRPAPLTAQRGVVLWLLLIIVAMAGGYAFYRNANSQFTRSGQDSKLAITLAQAKEALIAYAVVDDKHPGRLPCPDNLLDGDKCKTYVGALPWQTLDVRDYQDDFGTPLHLAIYNLFGGRDPAINSDTATGMRVIAADGSINDGVVGVIIAPRGALDPANSDGDNSFQVGKSATDGDNDMIAVITRQELMAAVEKRVVNEVRSCLDQHAVSSANTDHRYPWPAPLSATAFQGKANSLFGWVPATQPTAGPESALKSTIARLTQTLSQLSLAPDASQQMTALNALSDAIVQARNLFDVIFLNANQLKQLADGAASQLAKLNDEIDNAIKPTSSGRVGINRSEGQKIRDLAATPDATLDSLTDQLARLGIDVFPWQLGQYAAALGRPGADFAGLTLGIRDLLLATTTPRADISVSAALATTIGACNASGNLSTQCDASLAKQAAPTLITQLTALQDSVVATRVSLLASDVSVHSNLLDSLNTSLRNAPNAANQTTLLSALSNTATTITGITTGVSSVIVARSGAVTALNDAIAAAKAAPPNYALIDSSTATAITAITVLATAIANNEQFDNNVSHTSLQAAITAYETARTNFTQRDTATPRPSQSSITPYALTLGNATVALEIWAKSISANAALVAPLAKANPVAAGADPGSAAVLNGSAYKIAGDALASITGKNESAALLQAYIDTSNTANQATAVAALGETSALVIALLTAASNLDIPLTSTQASAFPMVWLSSRCDFLLPSGSSWWQDNLWAGLVFYQISSPTISEPGKLTVNGTGGYRVVALATGRALAGQNRATLSAADFLESTNNGFITKDDVVKKTRDGDATAPATAFTATPPSATFNDRLSY